MASDLGPPCLRLELIGQPSWHAEELAVPAGLAADKIIIAFKVQFTLPPQDNPAGVAHIHRAFSAPLHALTGAGQGDAAEREAVDMINHMLEAVRLPIIAPIAARIFAAASRAAAAAAGLRINFDIGVVLHRLPSEISALEQHGDEEHVTDIADLLLNSEHDERLLVDVDRVLPDHLSDLTYEERDWIIRTSLIYHELNIDSDSDRDGYPDLDGLEDYDFYADFYGEDFGDVFDDVFVKFSPASKESIEGLERVMIDEISENQPLLGCVVCLEAISVGNEAIRLPCSHQFHGDCIVKWLETSKFCPICRFEVS